MGETLPALPLALFFLAWFVAPFVLLVGISLFDTAEFQALGLRQYAKFFTDGYSLGVLWDTLELGFLVTTVCLPLAYALGSSAPAVAAACAASMMIVFRHRANVHRLRTGTERRLGARA